jgi:hypothetical protein
VFLKKVIKSIHLITVGAGREKAVRLAVRDPVIQGKKEHQSPARFPSGAWQDYPARNRRELGAREVARQKGQGG